ncbi:SPFH domain-containing protein [Conexibacter sp. SYSU D00693]|uniref:SPFH domain-containing protein n=1 Tax=Conexibacter sp. SYSU D00693 TaxID=2812560 RepID=UPI00196B7BEB|nr:SPFH domain-containing protein [Conexibacter sp. SYSU D00693]
MSPSIPSRPSAGPGGFIALGAVLLLGLVVVISVGAFVFSIKGTDAGTVCVVREGGPFDGRDVKEIRQPGEGPKPIGPFNKQDCLPTTERDSTDVIEADPTFPTRDSVQVVADGQALFSLTTDPAKVEAFYRKYGRRRWGGDEISSDSGWLNFLRQRFAPVVLDAQRQVIGEYDCTALNNLCQYVQNPRAAAREGEAKRVDNTQNLSEAQAKIASTLKEKLRAAFGDDYFENVRYQNLRIRFETEVQRRITEAQSLRTQAANAELDAQRKQAEARGEAQRRVEEATGQRRAAFQQAQAYRLNPNQRVIDRIRAFCGNDGCDPQVIGGDIGDVISSLSQQAAGGR